MMGYGSLVVLLIFVLSLAPAVKGEALSAQQAASTAGEVGEVKSGLSPLEQFFILANLEFTLLHEFSHMLMEELKLPVLGREEDAADRIAIIIMMRTRQQQSAAEVIPWLFAVAGDWYTEWELQNQHHHSIDYWDNHGLEIQRFHNIVCLVYGGKTPLLDDLIDTEILPFDRAVSCHEEYQQANHAVQWILDNYGYGNKIEEGAGRAERVEQIATPEGAYRVSYETPLEGQNQVMYALIKRAGLAEELVTGLFSRIRLNRPISIEFDNCVANQDAYWHAPTGSVTICYELLEHFRQIAIYRQNNSRRACGIPSLRFYLGARLRCPDEAGSAGLE